MLTLFHLEPSPRALHIADYLLENFGWPHKLAGTKYPDNEKSFRQTLSYKNPTSRGFFVDIDADNQRVIVNFAPSGIGDELSDWTRRNAPWQSVPIDAGHFTVIRAQ